MQKRNKILMMAVSSLLCLTLISSCLVSSIFSKYVTTDTASVSTVFKKWGVTITADVRDDLPGATVTGDDDGSAVVTISGLNMKPGDDFSDAIRFTITGTPEVKCQVIIYAKYVYGTNINNAGSIELINVDEKSKIEGINGEWYFMPIGLTFGAGYCNASNVYTSIIPDDYALQPWRYDSPDNGIQPASSDIYSNNMAIAYANGIASKMNANYYKHSGSEHGIVFDTFLVDSTTGKSEIVFHPENDTSKNINSFNFGFKWPYEYTIKDANGAVVLSAATVDEIATYMADRGGTNFTIKYTVRIEQV